MYLAPRSQVLSQEDLSGSTCPLAGLGSEVERAIPAVGISVALHTIDYPIDSGDDLTHVHFDVGKR